MSPFTVSNFIYTALLLPVLLLSNSSFASSPSLPASLSTEALGSRIVITASSQFAGAISSVTWNGKEFINATDHGRELQSASSFDGFGECFNPTEAGSVNDGNGETSTSKLLAWNSSDSVLKTQVQMAFWLQPGAAYPNGCGGNPKITEAQNPTALSNHILSKQLTLNYAGIQNAIEYLVDFYVPEHHSSATFETLTGYMPPEFSQFWTFDPKTGLIQPLSSTLPDNEQPLPLILSTPDGKFAMGIYSPDLPLAEWPNSGYGHFGSLEQFGVNKWNSVFRRDDTPVGHYNFRNYVTFGSVTQVMTGMRGLYLKFNPTAAPLSSLVPIYRFYNAANKDHFFTTNLEEGLGAGYSPEGVGFYTLPSAATNTRPLFRCRTTNGKHFISTAQNCENQMGEGQYGFVYISQEPGTLPLYRYYDVQIGDHLETTSPGEITGTAYKLESILGYTP